mmetsp:Transcript_25688/g.48715  ORF Transcript_25688/g.48715 Transcript_25688/m.48715 type:complete len:393 (-) Transcript_25688:567-1745(-)
MFIRPLTESLRFGGVASFLRASRFSFFMAFISAIWDFLSPPPTVAGPVPWDLSCTAEAGVDAVWGLASDGTTPSASASLFILVDCCFLPDGLTASANFAAAAVGSSGTAGGVAAPGRVFFLLEAFFLDPGVGVGVPAGSGDSIGGTSTASSVTKFILLAGCPLVLRLAEWAGVGVGALNTAAALGAATVVVAALATETAAGLAPLAVLIAGMCAGGGGASSSGVAMGTARGVRAAPMSTLVLDAASALVMDAASDGRANTDVWAVPGEGLDSCKGATSSGTGGGAKGTTRRPHALAPTEQSRSWPGQWSEEEHVVRLVKSVGVGSSWSARLHSRSTHASIRRRCSYPCNELELQISSASAQLELWVGRSNTLVVAGAKWAAPPFSVCCQHRR